MSALHLQQQFGIWLALVFLISPLRYVSGAEFTYDFSGQTSDSWQFFFGASSRAIIEQGRLVLDMCEPKAGKWAVALLKRTFSLPCQIMWRQQLAHDSPYTWFCGVAVESAVSGARDQIIAGLGGSGLKRAFFLGDARSEPAAVKVGTWYTLALELQDVRQRLSVKEEPGGQVVAVLEARRGLPGRAFVLRFFQNDPRLNSSLPDTYEQDRGRTEIDDLRIVAEEIKPSTPSEPGTTHPYKIPIVFNQAMRWVTKADGLSRGCVAYDAVGWMPLTGTNAVSEWLELTRWVITDPAAFPEQSNVIPQDDGTTVFKLPGGKSSAVFALRALQWRLDQHPVLEWAGASRGARWLIELTATDGVHPFAWKLWQSPWYGETKAGPGQSGFADSSRARYSKAGTDGETGASTASANAAAQAGRAGGEETASSQSSVDVRAVYRNAGWPNRYIEADVLVRLERTAEGPAELRLRLGARGRPAILPSQPVVVRAQEAENTGVPIEAVVVDSRGRLLNDASLSASIGGRPVPLAQQGSKPVYRAVVRGLHPGEYKCAFVALRGGEKIAEADASVSVTEMDFVDHYDRARRSYCTASGAALGPLLGDLFAWVPLAEIGTERRRLVCGPQQLEAARQEKVPVAYTKWRVLPRKLIDDYIDYMARCGVRVLRLTVNVSPAEYYLDACGHLAPHGLEQVSFILDAARRRNMRCVLNLTHYPYLFSGTGNNPPVVQYLEAGYRHRFDWTSDEMWQYLSGYLTELLDYTGQDPAVIAYTVTGENDQHYGPEWINRAYDLIKQLAPKQMVVLEQGGSIYECLERDPAHYAVFKPALEGGVGYRTYATYGHPTDCFMAVAARFYDLAAPSYLGEVACGVNLTTEFRLKLRDAMGIAFALQQPMAISWSAPFVECERKALSAAAAMIDWTEFRRAPAPVAIIVDRPDSQQVERLVRYEAALAAIPLDYEYIRPGADISRYVAVFDARQDFRKPEIGKTIPDTAVEAAPLSFTEGSHATYAVSADRRWLLAYVRNATHYEMKLCDVGREVELCRLADRKRSLRIHVKGMAAGLEYAVLDCQSATVVGKGRFDRGVIIELGETADDFVLVVRPLQH